ncbi:MAG: glycosyltransferase family 2 protein [Nanoarchaeota archaeon]
MEVSIIIPTYNEKENIQKLLKEVYFKFQEFKIKGELIVVDDNSPDGTGQILEQLKNSYATLKVIHRKKKSGLSSAVLEGFNISKGKILGVMDADLSHPPEKIPEMINLIKSKKADFVIGSRYIKGGKIEGWNIKRILMSKTATFLAKIFTKVKDPMSGFFMIKRECIKGKELNSRGFKILLELILKANYKKIKEIPIKFVNRTKGKSKAESKEIINYLKNLFGYWKYKRKNINRFLKFGTVGFIGTIINILILYYFTEFFKIYYIISAIIAFFISVTHNFILNKTWTFQEKMNHKFLSKYFKFLSISIFALLINLFFLYVFTKFFGIYYLISQIFAIGIALIINFLGNKIWTFKNERKI